MNDTIISSEDMALILESLNFYIGEGPGHFSPNFRTLYRKLGGDDIPPLMVDIHKE